MNRLIKSQKKDPLKIPTIESLTHEEDSLGAIKINHSVVASIVRLAALEIDGVYGVGGGFVDGLAEIFSKKESDRGVHVEENEQGQYDIDVRVTLKFGIELTKVALKVQANVIKQVALMTTKEVNHVNVIIDGIKISKPASKQHDDWETPHTD